MKRGKSLSVIENFCTPVRRYFLCPKHQVYLCSPSGTKLCVCIFYAYTRKFDIKLACARGLDFQFSGSRTAACARFYYGLDFQFSGSRTAACARFYYAAVREPEN